MSELRDQLQQSLGSAYTIDRELGGGGMSRVLVARDVTLRRDVVIKVLPPEMVAGVNVERFRREILVAAGLQHPHIVPVLAAGEMDGLPWFTMPYVEGESLRQRVGRGPLPINEAVNILREVAKALAYAHERGVIHRDIKPDNVLLSGGTAVVTDFGIAKALSASRASEDATATRGVLTQVGVSIGTPTYMAPEQAAADPNADARADLYAFGCMAYELLAGRPPFSGLSPQRLLAAHLAERPQPIGDLRRDTPPVLAELVMRCLEKEADKRPPSAADVVRVLDSVATTSGGTDTPSAVLLERRIRLRSALAIWAGSSLGAWVLAKAAVVGIGLPGWVVPGALIVSALGLPAILFTSFVQRTAQRALLKTPTLTPGGSPVPEGTIATIAMRASPHVTWRRTTRGGFIAFGAFGTIVAGFMILRALGVGPAGSLLAAGRMTSKQPILIADFAVKKGDTTLAGVVAEALRASLSQSDAITLVTPATVSGALQRMQAPPGTRVDLATARRIGQREGIKAIVDGDITALGGGYVVAVRLVTTDSGVTLASVQRAADGTKELIATVDAIGRELRGKIGESLRSVQNAPPLDQVTTPSLPALRAYSEGASAYDKDADFAKAIEKLSQAVTIDSGFAMAWRKLAVVYNAGGYPTAAGDSALQHAYRFRGRLSRREALLTEATYFYHGAGRDRSRALAAYSQLLAAGDSEFALNNYALILDEMRRHAAAESLFLAARRQQPRNQTPFFNLIGSEIDLGKFADAERLLADAAPDFPSPAARIAMAGAHAQLRIAAGDYGAGGRILDSLLAGGDPRAQAFARTTPADLAGLHGQVGLMRRRLAEASAADIKRGAGHPALDDSLRLSFFDVASADQPAQAASRMDAALAAEPLRGLPVSSRDYIGIATLYAQANRPDRARAILAQRAADVGDTARLRSELPYFHRTMGVIGIAEGRGVEAVRELWRGDSLPDGPVDECALCTYLLVAHAYDKANAADSAIVYFEKYLMTPSYQRIGVDYAYRAPAVRRLGELYEAKGNKTKAAQYYRTFIELWKSADASLQPQVAETKKRLERLARSTG